MKIDLENRIALVAEACSDVGKAICVQLAESGARVIGLTSSKENINKSRAYFKKIGLDIKIHSTDITDFNACKKIIKKIETDLGCIEIVINNSEYIAHGDFSKLSQQQWVDSMSVNLDSVYNLCRLISEGMTERGFGRIINFSSMYGRKGEAGQSAYAASKSGVHGFTMALAQELARKGVTVNTVSPGYIKTVELEDMNTEDSNSIIAEIPAARFGETDEVASLVDFLCSNQASFITGTDIPINGGKYIH
jgi:acetoacetyl-CoA reductase